MDAPLTDFWAPVVDYVKNLFPITGAFGYLALLMLAAGVLKFTEHEAKGKWLKGFFNYVPAVVCLYLATMIMGSAHIWEMTPEIKRMASSSAGITAYMFPSMIFLLLLKSDLREIVKIGPRMAMGFVSAALTMMIGFIVGYALLSSNWSQEAWKALAALCGSWIGGTVNLVAVQGALKMQDADMPYILTIDTICYSVWLLLMLLAVPLSKQFDRWTKADASKLEKVVKKLERSGASGHGAINFSNLVFIIGVAAAVGAVCFVLSDITVLLCRELAGKHNLLASLGEKPLWLAVYATVFGLGFGMTRIGKMPGTGELGNTLMFIFIAVIGSKVNLFEVELNQMRLYLEFGFIVLIVHFILLTLLAKMFKWDAYSCQTASLANIGGVASATVISGAYSPALVPIGVLMATIGTIIGTAGGLIVGYIIRYM